MMALRRDIQGLRALSIVLVVLAHAGVPGMQGGFVGVDAFFVLSGYLISGLLIGEYHASGDIRLLEFIARRLRRLLPALLLVVTVSLIAGLAIMTPYEAQAKLMSALYAGTWTSNFYFAFSETDYFQQLGNKDYFLHTWSLGVEEQFYLFWPLLLLCFLRIANGARLTLLLAAAFALSLAASWYITWGLDMPKLAFYMMPARIWQFSAGALAFIFCERLLSDGSPELRESLGTLAPAFRRGGIILLIGSAVFLSESVTYPGAWALLPSAGALLVLIAGHLDPVPNRSTMLSGKTAVFLGDHSYSWYLWHWPLLAIGDVLGARAPYETMLLSLVALLLSMFTYRCVELPFWKGRLSKVSAQAALLGALLSIGMVLGAMHLQVRPYLIQASDRATLPANIRDDLPFNYSYGCDTWYHDDTVVLCRAGPADASRTAVILGDSVGLQWFSIMPLLFQAPEWSVVVLTKSSCPMVDEDFYYERIGRIFAVCASWRDRVLRQLESIQPDVLVMGSASTYDFSPPQWVEGSSRILARLSPNAGQVFLIAGTPTLSFDAPACLERQSNSLWQLLAFRHQECEEDMPASTARIADYLQQAADRYPNVHLVNFNDLVCPANRCAARSPDGLIVFRDQQHVTNSFIMHYRRLLAQRIYDAARSGSSPAGTAENGPDNK